MVPLPLRVPKSHKDRLKQLASDSGYSVSDLGRLAIAHYLMTVKVEKEDSHE